MTATPSFDRYRFGTFELQPGERRLMSGDQPVQLGRHALDILIALVQRSGHLVTKDQLLERVWPKLVVEENTLQAHISALRRILGRETIATVSGRGYRFVMEVTGSAEAPASGSKHNLPQPLTVFVGREKEMHEVRHLLGTSRILTLTGSGGSGKTRLALQVSRELLRSYPDGVWFVELAALSDLRLVPQTIARVLQVKEQPGMPLEQTLCEHFEAKRLLLIIDNAEHLLQACAALTDHVLRQCEHVRFLVTSRERLGIPGEQIYRVPSLTVPDSKTNPTPDELWAYESVRLFIDRVRLQRPHFAITAENASTLASVCRRLDGIPLAIELAAPRLRAMSLEDVERRLDQRFALLTDGSRTAFPRQRTLRSLLDWSYDLLRDTEQALLRRLSHFAGGSTLQAAEAVCSGEGIEVREVLDLLTSLADKSLVIADEIQGAMRYTLLETVRQYARERDLEADHSPLWQTRHFDYFLGLAEEAKPALKAANAEEWLCVLDTEHDNLRAALRWSAAPGGDVSRGLRVAMALWRFWWLRGYANEAQTVFVGLLALPEQAAGSVIRAECLPIAAFFASLTADFALSRTLTEEALTITRKSGDSAGVASTLHALSYVAHVQGDLGAAKACSEEALQIRRSLGEGHLVAGTLMNLGNVIRDIGDPAAARAIHEEALAIPDESGDRYLVATILNNLSITSRDLGEPERAKSEAQESLAIYREIGEPRGIACALGQVGLLACDQGEWVEGRAILQESLKLLADKGDRTMIVHALGALAYASISNRPARSARMWGASERLREEIGTPATGPDAAYSLRYVAAARLKLADDEAFDVSWQEGRRLSLRQATEIALEVDVDAAATIAT